MTKIIKGVNDLATVRPDLAAEWHPTKNGNLTPDKVHIGSSKLYWWLYPYDDPITGKHFDFEWQARMDNRHYLNNGCPYINSQKLWSGFNDLATRNPELAKEWDYEANYPLTPDQIMSKSNKSVGWVYRYFDPRTQKYIDLKWFAKVNDRAKGENCPYISNPPKRILKGFNDLATTHPELAKQWSSKNTKNPTEIFKGTNKKYWWSLCCYNKVTNKYYNFEWEASPNHRTDDGNDCPFYLLSRQALLVYDILFSNNVKFEIEYKINQLINKRHLLFDFYIKDKYAIELDGHQHFNSEKMFGGSTAFNSQIKHDNLKNQYCYDNNTPLLRIPYIYDPITDKEKIENFVLGFIKTGEIPQEIIDFYSKYKFSNYADCILSKNLSETA